MPYELLVKEAYTLIDEIPAEKLSYVVDFLRSAHSLYESPQDYVQKDNESALEKMFAIADRHNFPSQKIGWNREELYGRM